MARPQRKDRSRQRKPERPDQGRAPDKPARSSFFSRESIRETIESLAIALVAALLLRTFVVEAFVIPTGSMATTLMGRHKDVNCPKCGYPYQVNASQEMDELERPTGLQVISGTCPMCRFTMDLGPRNDAEPRYTSYSGDRILADRASYEFGSPKRWEVVVFKYPLNASVNYIKRLIGLPNETVRIQYGDVWIQPRGEAHFALQRKPPVKVLATMRPVYDNDYLLPELIRKGWPTRWAPVEPVGWKASDDLKSFSTDGKAPGEVWLGYRHFVPRYEDWESWSGALAKPPAAPQPQLISDFLAYDTDVYWPFPVPGGMPAPGAPRPLPGDLGQPPDGQALGLNWVGDLVAEFELNATGEGGQVLVDLVKGGRQFLCRLDLAQGTVELTLPGKPGPAPKSSSGLRGPGKHAVRFANVDQQLLVWLDGRTVAFDAPTTYETEQIDTRVPDKEDLLPVRIGSRGAAVEVSHLKVLRDIYYVAVKVGNENEHVYFMTDFDTADPGFPYANDDSDPRFARAGVPPQRVAGFFSDPSQWQIFGRRRSVQFKLEENQFFMLGDNSPQSKDSRLWGQSQYYVDRELLIGQGLLVYWPHSWHRIPGTRIPFPYFPNFSRMGRIR